MSEVFNPLDKVNLGRIIADELIRQPLTKMPPDKFSGSGIYAIYYSGSHRLYEELVINFMKGNEIPIYVGKAIPEGGRKGVLNSDSLSGMSLFKRLSDHHSSICDAANFKRGELQNLWQIKKQRSIEKTHGAVFPTELANKIVQNFSMDGDTVLDPFMGTGTVGCVCKDRHFIGIEKDEKYFEIAKNRINNHLTVVEGDSGSPTAP